MSNPALDQATAKARADYLAAAEREEQLQEQLEHAKRVTAQFESIYFGFHRASLIEALPLGKAAA